jgi:hypothetical protein
MSVCSSRELGERILTHLQCSDSLPQAQTLDHTEESAEFSAFAELSAKDQVFRRVAQIRKALE